jgi:hypothetical protein
MNTQLELIGLCLMRYSWNVQAMITAVRQYSLQQQRILVKAVGR